MKKKTEKQIENEILEFLQGIEGIYWKNNNVGIYDPIRKTFRRPGRHHLNGVSDIMGCDGNGKIVCIEVKTQTGRASKDQNKFLNKIVGLGGIAFIARSVDDVKENLINGKWKE